MSKKILILNRQYNINSLFYFFKELNQQGNALFLYSRDQKMIKKFQENNLAALTLRAWPEINSFSSLLAALLFSPFLFFYLLIRLLLFKYKHQIDTLLVINNFDKIFTARVARALKLNVISLFLPETISTEKQKFVSLQHKAKVKTICFTKKSQEYLKGKKFTDIKKVPVGIKLGLGHQDNIFNSLAKEKESAINKKFFSVGTILNLNKKHNLEMVFSSLKACQEVIPNLQFIIIGDGKERKNLSWLARQMGIGSIVWFVGEQKNIKKWLEGLDVYLCAWSEVTLADINYSLLAMSSGLPVIGQKRRLGEITENFKHGLLLNENNVEAWSASLIRLQQNNKQRKDMGARAKDLIESRYTVERMVGEFLKNP